MVNKLELSIINVWEGTKDRRSFTTDATRATFWLQK